MPIQALKAKTKNRLKTGLMNGKNNYNELNWI